MSSLSLSRSRRGGGHGASKSTSRAHPRTVDIRHRGALLKQALIDADYTPQEADDMAERFMERLAAKRVENARTLSSLAPPSGGRRRSTRRKRKGTRRH